VPTRSHNEQRLRDAGVIIPKGKLKDPYKAVIEGLTPDEVDVIIAVHRRLQEADRVVGVGPDEPGMVTIMMPP
jgi:hypothetical protein